MFNKIMSCLILFSIWLFGSGLGGAIFKLLVLSGPYELTLHNLYRLIEASSGLQ